jgi:transposase-like protein
MQQKLTRQENGQAIASKPNQITRIDDHTYKVKSQSTDNEYEVLNTELGMICSCSDHIYRGVKCKHIHAVEFSLTLRKEVKKKIDVVIQPIVSNNCIFCKSDNLVKFGIRHNNHRDIQKFKCKSCNRFFSINIGFAKMKHNPQGITTAMQLYFSGESLRNTAESLRLIGVDVSYQTIWNWIKKYTILMNEYLEQIQPKVSGAWRTDELYLKIKGNTKYLYALMDDETRFWIAQQVADTKYTADVQPLFKEGKQIANKRPAVLISDGAPNFHTAYNKEFFTIKKPRTRHIAHIRLQGDHNNNKMERMNGEIRDREKTMRGLKKIDTPILTGYQLYHNYRREHEALDGKTPAELAGIKIEGGNKWITLIQNAISQNKK